MVLEFLEKILEPAFRIISPVFNLEPIITISIFSAFLTLAIILINRFAVNRKLMQDIKSRMVEIREKLSKAQKDGDKENVNKFLNEYMKTNSQYMKQTFKALLISMVVIILFLPALNMKYKEMEVATLPFSLPIIKNKAGWLFWYILVSLALSVVVKKIIGE